MQNDTTHLTPARQRIISAFRELVLSEHYEAFGVADIVTRAQVARSTFYANFRDKDDLLITSLGPILTVLGSLVTATANKVEVREVLDHIWENRQLGRVFFRGPLVSRLHQALLAVLSDPCDYNGIYRLHGTLGMLAAWCEGRIALDAAEFTTYLMDVTESS